jgi:hypothetical protein
MKRRIAIVPAIPIFMKGAKVNESFDNRAKQYRLP